MLREYVKWDYELRAGQPVEAVVDRALDIAMSEPRGPVYLTLPREVLAGPSVATRRETVRPLGMLPPEPARAAIEEAARLIAKAEFPRHRDLERRARARRRSPSLRRSPTSSRCRWCRPRRAT